MPIERVGVVRWKPSASEEAIASALNGVLALKAEIPGVIDIAAGRNESRFADGFTHAFLVRFTTRRARDEYDAHPSHDRLVKEVFGPITEKIVIVDFDSEELVPRQTS